MLCRCPLKLYLNGWKGGHLSKQYNPFQLHVLSAIRLFFDLNSFEIHSTFPHKNIKAHKVQYRALHFVVSIEVES